MPHRMPHAALVCLVLSLPVLPVTAQSSPAPASAPAARILGTVTTLADGSITVHPENGADQAVALTPQTHLYRIAPGETDLKNAQPMQFSELAVGDRVLIRAAGDPAHPTAAVLVAMKQGDIQQIHAQETGDWQRHGVAGIVASVDPAAGTVTLKPQGGAPPLVIHTTPSTMIRHYAPASTSFADTHKSTLADIHPGDQLRARGTRDPGSPDVAAQEIVDGSFRNISATVQSTDPAANSFSVQDLATRKPVTLYLEANTQLRKLPPELAERMAHRTGAGATGQSGGGHSGPASQAEGGNPNAASGQAGDPAGRARGGNGGDIGRLLERAPTISLADLKKGDAVMVVASGPGAPEPTAITVIAGVEPLLQASPEASAGLFSASWNLGGGGADAGGEGGGPQR